MLRGKGDRIGFDGHVYATLEEARNAKRALVNIGLPEEAMSIILTIE
jgi:hypothetical protein